jgi:hypothetical protein
MVLEKGVATESEVQYLNAAAARRFQFMYSKAHGLAFLLDPRFIGEGLPRESGVELENILLEIPADDNTAVEDTRREELHLQYTSYVIAAKQEKQDNTFRFKLLCGKRKTPLVGHTLLCIVDWSEGKSQNMHMTTCMIEG